MFLGIDSDDDSTFESSDAAVLPSTDCQESSNTGLLQSSMECQDVGTIADDGEENGTGMCSVG